MSAPSQARQIVAVASDTHNQNDKSPAATGLCLELLATSNLSHNFTSHEATLHYRKAQLDSVVLEVLRGLKEPYNKKGTFRSAAMRRFDEHRQYHGAIRYECPPPCVPVEHVRAAGGQWFLIVEVCPFCGCRHLHGGGNGDAPRLYGHRSAHCGGWFDTPGYILIPKGGEA